MGVSLENSTSSASKSFCGSIAKIMKRPNDAVLRKICHLVLFPILRYSPPLPGLIALRSTVDPDRNGKISVEKTGSPILATTYLNRSISKSKSVHNDSRSAML